MNPRFARFRPAAGAAGSGASGVATMAVAGVAAMVLAGCTGGSNDSGADDGHLTVVTTTSVYADVVQQVTGDSGGAGDVSVEALIDSAAQDPHSYEATPTDRLMVQDADLVVLNGGGYDVFMEELAQDAGVPVVNAVEVYGLEGAADAGHDHGSQDSATQDSSAEAGDHDGHDHGSFNEHIWYNPASMGAVGEAVAQELGSLDEANASTYSQNAAQFARETQDIQDRAEQLHLDGDYVATEPVADHLLEAAGLHNVTPTAFTVAVEDGTDAAPLVYDQVRSTLEDDAALLVYNEQTSTGQSQDLRTVAEAADLPVLAVSETLPEEMNYLQWMDQNIQDLQAVDGLERTTESHDH
ncbi:metal ABC transporter solute-binding protein, Zn/Mn family [Kocuria sp. ZOR0020]|uniref:metal ABC transporter substrate-binding protein n=1 Tax=Kocuria sp. ZOR0020 TaxID=1339234 RepID=UPI00068DF240|nr:zinc ABC transporter substrate-binding protein [Kocuria sp. ZOR0020]